MNAIQELKRLQKEIDKMESGMDSLTVKGWGNTSVGFEDGDTHEINYTRIKANQQKIKEIIESL